MLANLTLLLQDKLGTRVSDAVDDDTTVVDDDMSNEDSDDTSNDDWGDDAVFFRAARDIMNLVGWKVMIVAREDYRFRAIVRMVWDMLVERGLLPKKGEPKHLLWTLYFLKCYPKEGPGCAAVGGPGAIDPKTMRKWVWLFHKRINELADHVVSLFFCRAFAEHVLTPSSCCRCSLAKLKINFYSRLVDDKLNDCLMTIDGTDFHIQ